MARSLRSQSLCRFATNVFITYGNREGSEGAAPEARGLLGTRVTYLAEFMAVQMEVSSSPSEKIFNALRTLEAMW